MEIKICARHLGIVKYAGQRVQFQKFLEDKLSKYHKPSSLYLQCIRYDGFSDVICTRHLGIVKYAGQRVQFQKFLEDKLSKYHKPSSLYLQCIRYNGFSDVICARHLGIVKYAGQRVQFQKSLEDKLSKDTKSRSLKPQCIIGPSDSYKRSCCITSVLDTWGYINIRDRESSFISSLWINCSKILNHVARNSLIQPFTTPEHTQTTGTTIHHPYTTRNNSLTIAPKRTDNHAEHFYTSPIPYSTEKLCNKPTEGLGFNRERSQEKMLGGGSRRLIFCCSGQKVYRSIRYRDVVRTETERNGIVTAPRVKPLTG
ncbi:hypothetical protein J6590_058248 [Homalodisca vitripennis]|nr:hypothetical protein J6590_058248 [Homalodisca vitripennis]